MCILFTEEVCERTVLVDGESATVTLVDSCNSLVSIHLLNIPTLKHTEK